MVTRECSKIVQARACEGLLRIRCRRNRSVALQDLCLAPTRILEGELTVLSVRFCDKVSEGQPESTLPERVTDQHCTCIRTSSHLEGSRLMTKKRPSVAVRRASRILYGQNADRTGSKEKLLEPPAYAPFLFCPLMAVTSPMWLSIQSSSKCSNWLIPESYCLFEPGGLGVRFQLPSWNAGDSALFNIAKRTIPRTARRVSWERAEYTVAPRLHKGFSGTREEMPCYPLQSTSHGGL